MEIIIALLVLLSASLIIGELFRRAGLPSVAGQLIAGMVLGPMVLNIITPSDTLSNLSDISLFFITFLIGVEVTTEVLTEHISHALAFTAASFIAPTVIMALIAIFAFGLPPGQGVIVATAIGVPSISIISVLLYRYGILQSEPGHVILASVVLTDVIAFGVLAATSGGAVSTTFILIAVVVAIALLLLVDKGLRSHSRRLKDVFDSLIKSEEDEHFAFGGMLILGLIVAALLQLIGITFVLGAFFAGMLISEYAVGKSFYGLLTRTLRRISDSFFIPLFFSIAALDVTLPGESLFALLFAMVAASIAIGGILDYFTGKRFLPKISGRNTIGLFGGRGAVGIIIGSIALLEGIISTDLYSIIVFGTLIMAIVMPLLINRRLTSEAQKGSKGRRIGRRP